MTNEVDRSMLSDARAVCFGIVLCIDSDDSIQLNCRYWVCASIATQNFPGKRARASNDN